MENKNKDTIHKLSVHFAHLFVIFGGVLTLCAVLFVMIDFPPKQAQAFIPFGGRLIAYSPPVATGVVNCPAIATISNIGGQYKGVIYLMLPPSQPRLFYNFYTPGVAVLGSFLPTPLPFNCPLAPIYPAVYFGTSAR